MVKNTAGERLEIAPFIVKMRGVRPQESYQQYWSQFTTQLTAM
jgi:hypothetical protein